MSNILPYLAGIYIYPIKSFDAVSVTEANILQSGALANDREFALFDGQGNFVNGKRHTKIHQIRSSFDLSSRSLALSIQGSEQKNIFHIDKDRIKLESWLSNYFSFPVKIEQNSILGFPDDTNAPGPTIISTATLELITSWFPGLTVEDIRCRFRANLEIGGVPPFWEDRLFGKEGELVQFTIGKVVFAGVNPCQRCIVPTRDGITGESYQNFQKIFVDKRKETLPDWIVRSRFNHFYRLSVNTRVVESQEGKVLHLGERGNMIKY
ncbi:MOSC domain-containing protein [Limnofasciculus baicalensis]|uniref:MOSC N-terminal beta barrel domain-containing protein n=1 Tax=Limnofasciculus baicalensis BBK-W-15 TaxID=2699891 RepID=A0AAE3KMT7_9CYAN|nr:MOSC N-terminal beta barrel domain-containing protein [Limnofasciculus baicalensis]MCP2729569.1 MOSC N-terminal beta barrel domain-containing protein [Limnofasciculus baicalensis BBK-W-15]